MSTVHVVVPEGVDDPAAPSGGNVYDRMICRGLAAIGWSVREVAVGGTWPCPDSVAVRAVAGVLATVPDGAAVLLDGLIASSVPQVLVPEAGRLRLVVLVHMPLDATAARVREQAVLGAVAAVITTSSWTRTQLRSRYPLRPNDIHVAEPGVEPADLAPGTLTGGELLCVGVVAPHKGHDVLFSALAAITDLRWHCRCVGSLARDPSFVAGIRSRARADGIADRIELTGPLTAVDLAVAYAAADVLVLPSHAETYGMVVTEALARGLPVIATEVGGLPAALGHGSDGHRPGTLVPAGDPGALAAALRDWLSRGELRCRLRQAARERRETLTGWSVTSDRIARVLSGLVA